MNSPAISSSSSCRRSVRNHPPTRAELEHSGFGAMAGPGGEMPARTSAIEFKYAARKRKADCEIVRIESAAAGNRIVGVVARAEDRPQIIDAQLARVGIVEPLME